MRQDDWTSRLKERLDGHESPVPEGLWQQIEESLPAERKAKVRPLRRWIAAAAALLLAGGVGLGLLWQGGADDAERLGDASNNINNVGEGDACAVSADTRQDDGNGVSAAQTSDTITERMYFRLGNKHYTVKSLKVDGEPVGFSIKVEDDMIADAPQANQTVTAESRGEKINSPVPVKKAEQPSAGYIRKPRFYQRFSAGLMASSMAFANSKSTVGVMAPQMMLSPSAVAGADNGMSMLRRAPMYLPDFEERTEHKAPLTFGLRLGYSITPRMWVESGVQYSKLSSTFVRDMRGSELTSEQALHYVGVPLSVGYRIFDVGPLSFYGVAGAQADFNVKAKNSIEGVETDGVKDDVQFSANASLGAQVKLTPHLGVYVEPGARYYFDNGSNVQNYFKDKKLNFNLQVGARWNIGGK